ncbi:branched-chain amino acid ABC transporter permease [Rhizobium leguminosarum bv. trifolii]|uniref:branched-chain amino acid ABC transporter permease n=1 Tax=Rhizobium leguminosarum TaxID=384 RepID=UPI000E2FAEFF|nr:branched-chain amino acid ABC transporter permease [Rhizobium leguminosarum]RFB87067.1 branched-chain amino acid ABC transporter permease [Rhizobium leguminosarum bv. trifolii]
MQLIFDALSLGSLYALVALGIGLLFGVVKVVNFAYGDLITVGAYSLIVPSVQSHAQLYVGDFPWPLVVVIVTLVVTGVALICDFAIFRPLRNADGATIMIATFALSYFIQNTILIEYGGLPRIVNMWPLLTSTTELFGTRVPQLQLLTIILTACLLAIFVVFLRYTTLGLEIRAAAENFPMARAMGIRAGRVTTIAIVMSAFLAALVSLILTVQTSVIGYRMGVPLMVFGFIATIIGGMGSLLGAVVGGLAVGVLTVVAQTLLPEPLRGFRDAFVFFLIFAFLVVKPKGLITSAQGGERV